jgi:hypothetical protein
MPEEVLDDRQKRWLTPLRSAMARGMFVLHRIMMRVPLVGVRWTV